MGLKLYSGSGSPYAWRVQLALEHKALDYELEFLSFSAGDTRKPEFLALNPRHQVPVLVDDGFVLYESNAIVEYLDEAYAGRGRPLFPGDAKDRALVRRLVLEADNYFGEALDKLIDEAVGRKPEERDAARLAETGKAVHEEAAMLARAMKGPFLAGDLTAADCTLYPLAAFVKRCQVRCPDVDAAAILGPALLAWMARMDALPYLDKTIPPHWRAKA